MSIKRSTAQLAIAAFAAGLITATAAPAGAINNIKTFGTEITLKDYGMNTEIGYTVDGVAPSSDPVPYPVAGQLFASNVTAKAIQGAVNPMTSWFNARAENGDNYRALNVSTLSGGGLMPGGQTTGKVYFDVVGATPNSVVFSDAGQDLLGWIPAS